MSLKPGQILAHYRIEHKLGEGGMGVVWSAEDTKLRRRVALKVLPEATAADPERRARFEREARAVAALNHPNIVTLYSVEEAPTPAGPMHFITMELVEGRTLTQHLLKDGLTLQRWLEIAIPLADAVSRAHREGITHRDLKPDNIMIDQEGRLRVLDFGLAKLQEPVGIGKDTQAATVTSDTAEGRVLGTVAYMAPEQAEGKNVDSRSDVFSLGTILYEMATGERPFSGDTRMSTIGAILKDEPAPITEVNRSLPRHAGRIIRRCLAKDPERRYQNGLELRNELAELKDEVQSGVHGEGLPDAPHAASGPKRWGMLVAGVLLAVVAGVVISRAVLQGREETNRTYATLPITSGLGLELIPTWSPEGEFIAFAEVRNASMDVVVKPMAGGEPIVRADGPGDETTPRWSPDGRYLAYISTSEAGCPVYLVPPHGGPPRKLIDTGFRRMGLKHWTAMGHSPWSTDGRTLLVSRKTELGQVAIHRVDRDNGTAEPLVLPPSRRQDHSASYSPDGQRIVFVRGTGGPVQFGDVMMVSPDGGEPELIVEKAMMPAFRPDGRHLLLNRRREGGSGNLWELDLQTAEQKQLTFESVHAVLSFAVSATDRIAYQSFWHDTFLFAVDVATGERRQLTSHTKENFHARFSPDGKTIAYASTRTGNNEIFLLPLDGGPETRLTDAPGTDDFPDWSPDGAQLVYFANPEEVSLRDKTAPVGRRLTLVNRDGGSARVLAEHAGLGPARWSPSGELIAYVSLADGIPALWTVTVDGEDAKSVRSRVGGFDWYIDDRRGVYSTRRGGESELVAINLETEETRSLYVGSFLEMDVAPDGSAVALSSGNGHISLGLALLRLEPPTDPEGLPRAVGEPETIIEAEGTWHIHLGGWSADSKSIVYTRDQDYGDIFELVEK